MRGRLRVEVWGRSGTTRVESSSTWTQNAIALPVGVSQGLSISEPPTSRIFPALSVSPSSQFLPFLFFLCFLPSLSSRLLPSPSQLQRPLFRPHLLILAPPLPPLIGSLPRPFLFCQCPLGSSPSPFLQDAMPSRLLSLPLPLFFFTFLLSAAFSSLFASALLFSFLGLLLLPLSRTSLPIGCSSTSLLASLLPQLTPPLLLNAFLSRLASVTLPFPPPSPSCSYTIFHSGHIHSLWSFLNTSLPYCVTPHSYGLTHLPP